MLIRRGDQLTVESGTGRRADVRIRQILVGDEVQAVSKIAVFTDSVPRPAHPLGLFFACFVSLQVLALESDLAFSCIDLFSVEGNRVGIVESADLQIWIVTLVFIIFTVRLVYLLDALQRIKV